MGRIRHVVGGIVALTVVIAACTGCGGSGGGPASPSDGATGAESGPRSAGKTPAPGVPGVSLTVRAGEVEIERTLPVAAFTLREGEALDPRLPPGPFDADIVVTFDRGGSREAYLGAEIRGGGLIMFRGEDMIRSSYAEGDAKLVMTHQPVTMARTRETIRYQFSAEGPWPIQFRAMWRPLETTVPQDLPSSGHPLIDGDAAEGMKLIVDHQCVACHRSGRDARQAMLDPASAPDLSEIGGRAQPSWLRSWLADPTAVDPDARMPRLVHGDAADEETIEDLTHFLVSLGGPIPVDNASYEMEMVDQGRTMYHEVGCVPCHGPLEPAAEAFGTDVPHREPARLYRSLERIAGKTSIPALVAYLADPLAVHPDGRMPSLDLIRHESLAIALYLDSQFGLSGTRDDLGFEIDAARVERGRAAFVDLGCGNCHRAGADAMGIASDMTAPALEALSPGGRGCLAASPPTDVPDFGLLDLERERIVAFLARLPEYRTDRVPIDELALTFERLDCTACHAFHTASGPEPAIEPYLRFDANVDLGREGRMPPNLTLAGARLKPSWMARVLEDGARARPYMLTRMPQFGAANIGHAPELLIAAGGASPEPVKPTSSPPENANASGRALVGSQGLNCIMCHGYRGLKATAMPGPDLASMPGRLRYDWFMRWVADPKSIRPDTRMPNFFIGGRSGLGVYYEGRAEDQVRAIWAHLEQVAD